MSYAMSAGHFHGDTLERRATRDLILTEDSYLPDTSLPVHHHSWSYFCFVLEGTFTEQCGRQNRVCWPGTLIYHPIGEEHSDHFARSPVRLFNIEIAPSRIQEMEGHSERLHTGLAVNGGLPVGLAMRLHKAFIDGNRESATVIEDLALQLFAEIWFPLYGAVTYQAPAWLEDAREMVRFGFRSNLSVSGIAEALNIHPVHLSRTFRKVYGRTISEAILHYRIEYACRLLASEDEPLAVIAYNAGFSDQSHFTREFKRTIGMTPGKFRRSARARPLPLVEDQ